MQCSPREVCVFGGGACRASCRRSLLSRVQNCRKDCQNWFFFRFLITLRSTYELYAFLEKFLTILFGSHYPPTFFHDSSREEASTLKRSSTVASSRLHLKEEEHIPRAKLFFFYHLTIVQRASWKNNNKVFREKRIFLFFQRVVVVW